MRKKWNILKSYDSSKDVIQCILENRGITSPDQIEEFLNPKPIAHYLSQFPPEFKTAIKDSKDLILKYVDKKLPILIYGDYDTDGVCATSILYSTLVNVLGHEKCCYFIPNRFEHGYGLSEKSLHDAYDLIQKTYGDFDDALLITVDTGITAVLETELAQGMGFKVIITDHHQKPAPIPKADIILWSDKIVGAGISWILSKALGLPNFELMELMALATVTDLQELTGFNRSVLIKGLEIFNTNPSLGIKKLLEASGKNKEVTVYDLGWVLGPRVNALGRMENASLGVELLTSTDEARAEEIAHMLGQTNVRRQDETEKMYEIANVELGEDNLIFSVSADYHEGIIGLVASRLVQKHYKPAIVVAHDAESNLGKGSVRSVPGINIIEVLRKYENLFEKLGGHPMAAGFSIKMENVDNLKKELTTYMNANFTSEYFVPFLDIEMEIPVDLANLDFFTQLRKLAPYGVANPEPIFCSKNLKIADFSYVGKEAKHLSLKFFQNGNYFKAIYFNADTLDLNISNGTSVSVAYALSRNDYNGRITIDLIVKDLMIE
jgi:single-stranded-DNA-specific exonuclease